MSRTKARATFVSVQKKNIHIGQPMAQAKKVMENRLEEERLIAEVVAQAKKNGTYGRYYSQPMQRSTKKSQALSGQ